MNPSLDSLSCASAPSGMIRSMNRIITAIIVGSFLIWGLSAIRSIVRSPLESSSPSWKQVPFSKILPIALSEPSVLIKGLLIVGVAVAVPLAIFALLRRLEGFFDADAIYEARFLDSVDMKYVDVAIAASASLSLFLELALIRWQSSVVEFLAFYKNFSLLACFAGLGLGYALANRSRIPLLFVMPLLAWQFVFMMVLRLNPVMIQVIPFREELTMGIPASGWAMKSLFLYILLTIIFLITALTFLPVGQLCGRLMERRSKLRSYGLNLIGSLVGVVLMLLASFFWTPPLVWFALCFLGILVFSVRRTVSLYTSIACALIAAMVLAWWPVDRLWNRVYSPYQLLEIGTSEENGLTLIRAAGHYYQRIHDFSRPGLTPAESHVRAYYDLPYKGHAMLNDVAVVGAGTGNDVAAALRAGASQVDAIEIDPAILLAGKMDHPEKPYNSPRTHAIVNDARSFFRTADRKYDLIVYGLLDSHTLLSHGSGVRLDSFVYTVEGLREARSRLKPNGALSLSFSVMAPNLGRKIYLMLQDVFDGRPPICIQADYDGAIIFLESNDPNASLSTALAMESGFTDRTAAFANPALQASLSTDDWPFFYMPRRVYPVSYLIMVLQILILALIFGRNFLDETPKFSHLSFFFLGAGFMLIETKGITEIGLTFGNTWQVIGVVIAAVLIMAFFGNCAVSWLNIRRPLAPYMLLWAALAIGYFIARSGGFGSTPLGRLETVIVLTCPLFFSGIVFSTQLTAEGNISGMMATNLLGAICGGLLEYNSMYFGFRWLYLAATVCYLLAFLSNLTIRRQETEQPDTAPAPSAQAAGAGDR